MRTDPKELAAALRVLANMIDEHPEIAGWYEYPAIDEHIVGATTAGLDRLAEIFEVAVRHLVHANGGRFSSVATKLGPLEVRLQCMTEDYEKATGKTVDPAAVTA